MLSWILGARRFTSIERICDARTPVTVTSCNSSDTLAPGVVGAVCCAESCASAFSAETLVASDVRADVAAAASNAMEMAIDRGCLRYTFDTAFPSRLLSSGSQMPCGARSANAQMTSVIEHHVPSTSFADNGVVETVVGRI